MTDLERPASELEPAEPEVFDQPAEQVRVISVSTEQTYSGPLPPPQALKEYEEILPGAAERVFKIAEGEAESVWNARAGRQRLANRIADAEQEQTKRGMYLGGALGGGLLVVAVVLALEGATWPAVVAAISQLVPTLAVFIPGARARWRNRRTR